MHFDTKIMIFSYSLMAIHNYYLLNLIHYYSISYCLPFILCFFYFGLILLIIPFYFNSYYNSLTVDWAMLLQKMQTSFYFYLTYPVYFQFQILMAIMDTFDFNYLFQSVIILEETTLHDKVSFEMLFYLSNYDILINVIIHFMIIEIFYMIQNHNFLI